MLNTISRLRVLIDFLNYKLGNDVFGKDYVENFKKNNINTKHVFFTNEAATGVAPICVDNNGKEKFVKKNEYISMNPKIILKKTHTQR
jgi:sugar/nucleoside kinase (ribokinase family)